MSGPLRPLAYARRSGGDVVHRMQGKRTTRCGMVVNFDQLWMSANDGALIAGTAPARVCARCSRGLASALVDDPTQ